MGRGLRRLVVVAAAKDADTRQPMADVEGVGDLAKLAVAYAVDPGRDLLAHDFVDRGGKTAIERRLLDRPPGFARLEELEQIGRARQAADMGRQDAIDAAFHIVGTSRNPPSLGAGRVISVQRHRARAQRAQHEQREPDDDEIHDRRDHEDHMPAPGRGLDQIRQRHEKGRDPFGGVEQSSDLSSHISGRSCRCRSMGTS